MFRNKLTTRLIILLMLPFSILVLPATSSNAISSKQLHSSPIGYNQEKTVKRVQLHSSSQASSPSTLRAEFINPNHPNYMQAFVNVTFDLAVRLSVADFNYTQINASIAFGTINEPDPLLTLVNASISPGNTPTKFIGNLTAGENKTITWKAILIGYDAAKDIRLAQFNAIGLANGLIPRVTSSQVLIETHFPIMTVDGPFPIEEHEDVDYELEYEETKELMLNITSSPSSTYNLTGVRVTVRTNVTTNNPLAINYVVSEIGPLAPGEYYIYNFTITSVSKKKAGSILIIEVTSSVTPTARLERLVSSSKAPEDSGFGPNPIETLLVFFGVFALVRLYHRRKK